MVYLLTKSFNNNKKKTSTTKVNNFYIYISLPRLKKSQLSQKPPGKDLDKKLG